MALGSKVTQKNVGKIAQYLATTQQNWHIWNMWSSIALSINVFTRFLPLMMCTHDQRQKTCVKTFIDDAILDQILCLDYAVAQSTIVIEMKRASEYFENVKVLNEMCLGQVNVLQICTWAKWLKKERNLSRTYPPLLIHCGPVMIIVKICSGNGLSPVLHQAIITWIRDEYF